MYNKIQIYRILLSPNTQDLIPQVKFVYLCINYWHKMIKMDLTGLNLPLHMHYRNGATTKLIYIDVNTAEKEQSCYKRIWILRTAVAHHVVWKVLVSIFCYRVKKENVLFKNWITKHYIFSTYRLYFLNLSYTNL